jgi:hypothetical protein
MLQHVLVISILLAGCTSDKEIKNYAALENPFRMQKINLGVNDNIGHLAMLDGNVADPGC